MDWINANEQRPVEDGEYLAVFLGDNDDKFIVLAHYVAEDNRWEVYDHYGNLWGNEVLYWLPLPQIPKQ